MVMRDASANEANEWASEVSKSEGAVVGSHGRRVGLADRRIASPPVTTAGELVCRSATQSAEIERKCSYVRRRRGTPRRMRMARIAESTSATKMSYESASPTSIFRPLIVTETIRSSQPLASA